MQIIWNMKNQEFMMLTGLFWAMQEFMNHPQIRIQVFWFVWDFFGSRKVEGDYDGNSYSDITDYPNWSFLTINAVDGSIIDRDLGY